MHSHFLRAMLIQGGTFKVLRESETGETPAGSENSFCAAKGIFCDEASEAMQEQRVFERGGSPLARGKRHLERLLQYK